MADLEYEEEILQGRRAWPVTQSLFPVTPRDRRNQVFSVGWAGSDLIEETPAFAVVDQNQDALADLVGEFLQLDYGLRKVVVYVLGSRDLFTDVALTARAFQALAGGLYLESVNCLGRVVE